MNMLSHILSYFYRTRWDCYQR